MLFEADSVVSGYGALEVLHGVSLSIEEGEIVSVLGANGAGKTTFLRTVSGVLDTWEGKITLEGADLGPLTTERRAMAGLGHLPEGRGIFQNLTVRENLELALSRSSLSSPKARDRKEKLVQEFNLSSFISVAMTEAPSFAKAIAVDLPIPCAAAVTIIFLFFNLIYYSSNIFH